MRPRRPEGTRGPVLFAVVRHLHYASMRDRLDPHACYRDGEVALAAAVAAAVSPEQLALCRLVAAREEDARVLGPEPSREAIEMAGAALVEAAGVRWGAVGWTII